MNKKGYLEEFFEKNGYCKWIKIIDWILNDDKFRMWRSSDLTKYTKSFKSFEWIARGKYVYGKRTEVNPEDYNRRKNRQKKSIIIMVNGQGEAKDIVRHIRNGIAHGRAKMCTRNGVKCVELKDYGKFGSTEEKSGQTAYMLIPIDMIEKLYDLYNRLSPQ